MANKSIKKKPVVNPKKVIKVKPEMISENFQAETISVSFTGSCNTLPFSGSSTANVYGTSSFNWFPEKDNFPNMFFTPNYVGGYKIGKGTYFNLIEKPTWLHRKFSKLLLGWEWVDNKN
jgi:hypothetical protein